MIREALIYLTNLDSEHMESLVLQRVAQECLERKDDLDARPTSYARPSSLASGGVPRC